MKRLLMIALLAAAGFTAKAQFAHNNSTCDVEFREVCIDPMCGVTPITPWQSLPAMSPPVPLSGAACIPPDEIAFEVQYNFATTGCTGSVLVKAGILCTPVPYPMMANLPWCPCSPHPLGPHIHFNGTNLHIDP